MLFVMIDWIRRALPPSGGIFYHYLAMRFSRTLWRDFRAEVDHWLTNWLSNSLTTWSPHAHELIIFGSSAGYSLSTTFLEKFNRVIVVEPDPLARLLLRRRFPQVWWEFTADRNLLAPIPENAPGSASKRALDQLHTFLKRYPDAAVLFSNVLGQLPLEFPHLSDELFASHLIAIRAAVKDRAWASYHDLLSTWAKPKSMAPFELPSGPLDLEAFIRARLEPPPGGASPLEVTDHQTHALSIGEPTACTWWEIAPGRYHLIGFLCSPGPS
ncbi:MAG: hypothetical protein NDI61_00415 [Bdellovibrionaceae bacterium]|nr:hypothetical protein [Pseudobdellovibrionaceae bacterium]